MTLYDVSATPPRAGEDASHFVRANGEWHHVLEYGDAAESVVVLPGITTAAASWDVLARRLSPRLRVFTIDVRGRGLSGRPPKGYGLDDYAADLLGIVDRLRITPHLLGHSMGARIAAQAATNARDRFGHIILVDPPLSGPGRRYPFPLDMYHQMMAAAADPVDPIGRLRAEEPGLSDTQLLHRVRWLRTIAPHAVDHTWEAFHTEEFTPLWRAVAAPVTLIHGAASPVVTPADARDLAQSRPDASVHTVQGAGHLVQLDQPDDLLHLVANSLH